MSAIPSDPYWRCEHDPDGTLPPLDRDLADRLDSMVTGSLLGAYRREAPATNGEPGRWSVSVKSKASGSYEREYVGPTAEAAAWVRGFQAGVRSIVSRLA